MFDKLKEGDVVSIVWRPTFSPDRRTGTDNVLRVTKTFVELNGGRKFSTRHGKELKSKVNENPSDRSYLCTRNEFWEETENRQKIMREMNELFSNLSKAAQERNWEKTKESFAALQKFIDE